MPRPAPRIALFALAAALLLAPAARAQNAPSADYQAKLAHYQQARQAYDAAADAYWNAVIEKRRMRNAKRRAHLAIGLADYVLTQPPLYSGPPRPINPPNPPRRRRRSRRSRCSPIFSRRRPRNTVSCRERPASEMDFKRAYARRRSPPG